MEYVSLEERIMKECNDQAKEYLIKNGTNGLINLFTALSENTANEMMDFLKTGRKNTSMDLLLCIIPLVLKNGKSFETKKTICSIKSIKPDISNKDLFDCLILFSYMFDLFYGTNLEDTLENVNSLNEDCINLLNVSDIPKLEKNNIDTAKTDYNSIIVLKDYIKSLKTNYEDYDYSSPTSKAIIYFLRGINNAKSINNDVIEKKYGAIIQKFLLSI